MSKLFFPIIVFFLLGIVVVNAQNLIFWGNLGEQNLKSKIVGSSSKDTIVTNQGSIRRLRVHNNDRQIYWAAGVAGKIRRSNFDGSNFQDILSVDNSINMIAIDEVDNLVYFTELSSGTINVVSTSGANLHTIISGTGSVQGLDIDHGNGYVFWTESDTKTIKRAKLNGTNIVTILTTSTTLYDLQLDPQNQHIYFSNRTTNKIQRVNYDGTNLIDLVAVAGTIVTISLDLTNLKLAWTESGVSNGIVGMSNLDGSNLVQVASDPVTAVGGVDIFEDPTLAIDEDLASQYKLLLSPNPMKDMLRISHEAPMVLNLHLYDIQGRLIRSAIITSQEFFLDVSELPSGMYQALIESDRKRILSRKLVRQ